MGEQLDVRPRVAGAIVAGVFLAFLGLMLAVVSRSGHHPLLGLTIFGVILIALAVWWMVATAMRKVTINSEGITRSGMFGSKTIAWDEISHYRYWSTNQQAGYYGGGQGGLVAVLVVAAIFAAAKALKKDKGMNRTFSLGGIKLFSKDGRALTLDTQFKDVDIALDRCFDELHPRMKGREQNYAPFTVTAQEVSHAKKGSLALAEIEKVIVGGGQVTIKKRGKRLAWAKSAMRSTNNTMLLVEDLSERGVVVDANAEVFMPLPLIGKLSAVRSRHANLPSAVVVQR